MFALCWSEGLLLLLMTIFTLSIKLFFCFSLSHWLFAQWVFVSKNSVIYCILTIKFVFLGIAMLNVVLAVFFSNFAVFFSSVTAIIKLKQLICYSERLSLKFCPFFSNFAASFVLFVIGSVNFTVFTDLCLKWVTF